MVMAFDIARGLSTQNTGATPNAGMDKIVGARATPVTDKGATNRKILKGLGIDLDTILTPNKSRKLKRNGRNDNPLRGEPELKTALGE